MWPFSKRRTHDEWWEYLNDPSRKLSRAELDSLELMTLHFWLERVSAGLGTNPDAHGGYLEQIKNIFDALVRRVASRQQSRPSEIGPPTSDERR